MLNEHYDVTTAAYAVGYESYPISVGNVGMIVVSVLAMSSAAVSAAEGDESVTTTVNLLCSKVFLLKENQHLLQTH